MVIIDSVNALYTLGFKPGMSVTRAITKLGLDFSEHSDPLTAANKIITKFGGLPASKPIQADIIAKALVEQAIVTGGNYNPEEAYKIAMEKFNKIERTMPYIFAGSTEDMSPSPRTVAKESRSNDKKTMALEIYNRENGKSSGEIAQSIATELDITYANAYYYVSRVFAKYK